MHSKTRDVGKVAATREKNRNIFRSGPLALHSGEQPHPVRQLEIATDLAPAAGN